MKKQFSILIAEDDDGHFLLIKKHLKEMGFKSRVIRFIDGQEILDFLLEYDKKEDDTGQHNYLLILDIRMPKMNGIEVLEQIKKYPKLKTIPVVMLTSSDSPVDIKRCAKIGCNDYVIKPLDKENFREVINKVASTFLMSIVEASVS
jgi:CheY-like chemotaxis protein